MTPNMPSAANNKAVQRPASTSSSIMPVAPPRLLSAHPTGHGFKISNSRNNPKASAIPSGVNGAVVSANQMPTASSITMADGSLSCASAIHLVDAQWPKAVPECGDDQQSFKAEVKGGRYAKRKGGEAAPCAGSRFNQPTMKPGGNQRGR